MRHDKILNRASCILYLFRRQHAAQSNDRTEDQRDRHHDPRRLLASATKSNALRHSMVLWDEVVSEVSLDFPSVALHRYHVDALAARMITHPQSLDVIVGSNL